jgi:AraC family transcriptional regulator
MAFGGLVAHADGDPAGLAALEGRVERGLEFANGRVEIRRYALGEPVENVSLIRDDVYLVNLALSRRPPPTTIAHLGLDPSAAPQEMGRVVLVPPGSTVRVCTPSGQSRSMHCALNANLIETLLQRKPGWNETRFRETARVDSPELEWLLLKIYRELMHRSFGSEVVVESLANAACVELIRCFRLGEAEEPRAWKGGLAPWRMRRLRERVYAEAPTPSVADLAELCGMTVRQLARAFKAETGQTVGKFVEAAKLERARALLIDTDLSIAEIATALGFSHPASFAYAFRRATGVNPSEVEGRRISRGRRARSAS